MGYLESTLLSIFRQHVCDITHNGMFSQAGASFSYQVARNNRPNLPRDAVDYRVLVECPPEDGIDGWEAEVFLALRDGKIWNPAAHLSIARLWADDTDDRKVILARVEEWAQSV